MERIVAINDQIERMLALKSVQSSRYITELNILKDRLNDKTFRIVVVGEFSSGKSTFINSIIGKDILKHAATETTAAVTYIYNVPRSDQRIDTCDIVYVNGKKQHISNLEQLREYTTVNSGINVAETIQSVSVYVNFLNVSYPVMIADTPGLNGIADKHRAITLDEIKKAHACIYLLSINGVKSTDIDFIKVLLNYQNRFIFIQNFIDLLRESENDTLQGKIDKDKESLRICFGKENAGVNYDVYGISAARALASKDISKTKVFDDDLHEIADRAILYDESHYQDFENCLYKIIESGEYLTSVENSVKHTIRHMIGAIRGGINEEIEINKQIRAQDGRTKNIDRARKLISRIDSQKNDRKKRLENFMISRDSENRKSLHEYIRSSLENLNESIKKDIDEKIRTYDQLASFADYYNSEPPKYYSVYISNTINSKLIPDVDGRIQDNLSHLYDEALLRVSDFVTNISGSGDKISLNINSSVSAFDVYDIHTNLEIYKAESERKKLQIKSEEASIANKKKAKRDTEDDIDLENQCNNEYCRKYEQEKQMLGSDPGVKQRQVEKTRQVERKGILKGTREWLFGAKTETYWAYEDDYSEQNEWKTRKAALEEKNRQKQEMHASRIMKLESRRKSIEDEIKISAGKISRLTQDIADLEKRMEREKQIYEISLKANQEEYCSNAKRKLKGEIEKSLFDSAGRQSACDSIMQHIDTVDLETLPAIQKSVMDFFEDSVNAKLKSLSSLINDNEKELASRYEFSKKELNTLNDIAAQLR